MAKIKVHEKALGHLSRGLYRSPASALRELVSNAWDANATVVRLSTNYPTFFQISVEDNGEGFSKEDFTTLMEGGIGNSTKRPSPRPLVNGRPIIGRLGIGLLGIAQVCAAFTIISKPKNGSGFKARVRLYDLLRQRLDQDDADIVKDTESVREVDIGEYDFEEFHASERKQGTIVIADAVHPTFTRTFQQSLKFEKYKDPPGDWKKALGIVSGVHSLQELGDYWRLLWELAACCPVPYVGKTALPDRLIDDEQKRLKVYDFRVYVDGIQLFKPVWLSGNAHGYTTLKIPEERQRVYGKDLVFHGYIVVQEGSQLRPDELRGVLLRVKNVGIGYYDPSMLDYRFNEGPRSRWLTAEILVDEGLEDALNIDRDSFNRFHPEYRAIQAHVHHLLRETVFPKVYKQIDVRSEVKARSTARRHDQYLREVIAQTTESKVKVKYEKDAREDRELPEIEVNERKNGMEIVLPKPEMVKTKRLHRQLATAILSIFEVALKEKGHEKQRQRFTELLLKLLAKW